jgi:hypothetical protein
MGLYGDMVMYGRFATGLRGFLKKKLDLEEARAIIRRRLEEREDNFLRLVERGVYGNPRSPYLPLLKLAGCAFSDLRTMVRAKGLEPALTELRRSGVYVAFDEFKGRAPIERFGKTIPVRSADFDNPYAHACYRIESGGSTGVGTRVFQDLDHLASRAPDVMVGLHATGTLDLPQAIWRGPLPNGAGINLMLVAARTGRIPEKWFTPILPGDRKTALQYRLANFYVIEIGRLFGARIPRPEPVGFDQAAVIARWAAEKIKTSGGCFLRVSASPALRIALAAIEEGIDLTGCVFSGGGEPPTEAKVKVIRSTGARTAPSYFFSEAGIAGLSCGNPCDANDQHLAKDHLALIQFPRKVPGTDVSVDAFHFTTLLATAPKILLNVEVDDYGIVERRSCGCPLEELGLTEHIREIRSYRKLTGEGMSLVGSDMERILDEVLPARFGGSPLDYQLMEEEDERGFTRLSVIVSHRVRLDDESEVVRVVLDGLAKGSASADGARAIWASAGTLRVKRMEPIWTARGKLLPLHLAKRAREASRNAGEGTRER